MSDPRPEEQREGDATGALGQPPLEAASWVFIAAGLMLLLPRQWASAGIAIALGIACRVWHARRAKG